MRKELFSWGRLRVTECKGVVGLPVVTVEVGGSEEDLPEGVARQLHLALRGFVRRQKRSRGDTPRGRRQLAEAAQPQLVEAPRA